MSDNFLAEYDETDRSPMAEALLVNSTLTALHVCNSGLFATELRKWGDALRRNANSALTELGCAGNSFEYADGCEAIGNLVGNSALKTLDISFAHFHTGGFKTILRSLVTSALTRLVLIGADFDNEYDDEDIVLAWRWYGRSDRPVDGLILNGSLHNCSYV